MVNFVQMIHHLVTGWPDEKIQNQKKKFENQKMIRKFPHQNQKNNQKADLNAASRQTCFVQHIIYALISFRLLVDDKQKKTITIFDNKKYIYIETKYRMLQF